MLSRDELTLGLLRAALREAAEFLEPQRPMKSLLRNLFAVLALACAAPALAQQLYLWEVSSLTNRVYLYGTVHIAK